MSQITDIEAFIRDSFYRNFELLKQEGGSSIAPETRDVALNQVFLYWYKLREVAERITDTEVPIHLPNQRSPKGRQFGIEGVVDVIRDNDKTIMYDIKTHDPEFVQENPELYAMQLNLYAYVWHELRGEPLDGIAIIATAYPEAVRNLFSGKLFDELTQEQIHQLDELIQEWKPVISMDFEHLQVLETIRQFGEVVDNIEDRIFNPPDVTVLETEWQQSKQRFATRVCRNCDARFSCDAYHAFARKNQQGNFRLIDFVETFYGDIGESADQEGWIASNLNAIPEEAYINALLGE